MASDIYIKLIEEVMRRNPSQSMHDIAFDELAYLAYKATDAFFVERPPVPFGPPRRRYPSLGAIRSTAAGQQLNQVQTNA